MPKIRLSKLMSELGLCSRREADDFIARGWVQVDGERVTTLGTRVDPGQRVVLDPRAARAQQRSVTILLHKPIGYVSAQPEKGYSAAVSLIRAQSRFKGDRSRRRFTPADLQGLAPAGRLDIDSSGLLVLTQDGRIARALVGERSPIEKEYLVRVRGQLKERELALLREGLVLDGRALAPAQVSWINRDQLRFTLKEGRKRQIRRMCAHVGLEVIGLKRVRIGRVRLADLPPGQWRYLGEEEAF